MKGIFAMGASETGEAQPRARTPQNDPHHAENVAALKYLRKSLDKFQRVRMLNNLALRGTDRTCRYTPDEMQVRLGTYRDPEMEMRFRQQMYELLKQAYGREPTQEEMQLGPGLGLLPALLGLGAIFGSTAWGLSSITDYLTRHEELARGVAPEQLTPSRMQTVGKIAKGALIVTTLGAAGYGSYRLWKWLSQVPGEAKGSKPKEAKPEEEEEEVEEEVEEEPELLEAAESMSD